MIRTALLTLALVAAVAIPALAFSGGAPAHETGEASATATCATCHGAHTPAPTMTITGLEGPFVQCDTASITLTITREGDATGATGTCSPNRCAGFEASTDTAGVFVVTDDGVEIVAGTVSAVNDNEVTHHAKRAFDDDGIAVFDFDLTQLQAGSHTLFVAANDVNGVGSTGNDRVGTTTVTFDVAAEGECGAAGEGEGEGAEGEGAEGEGAEGEGAEGEGANAGEGEGDGAAAEGEGEPPGCSSTTSSDGVPVAALLAIGLGVVGVSRRRRR